MMSRRIKWILILNVVQGIYSLSTVCSKFASQKEPGSAAFVLLYVAIIGLLGLYAICWQQVIKRLPLTTAFANKAVTVVWGIIWGAVFFYERITPGKLLGAAIVIVGVVLYVLSDKQEESHDA